MATKIQNKTIETKENIEINVLSDGTVVSYPDVRPVQIHTKNLPWWKRGWVWLTSIRKWELREDYFIEYKGYIIKLPKGFIFDFASIPRPFWPLLSPTGVMLIPSMPHDCGYKCGFLLTLNNERIFEGRPREFFDKLFRDLGKSVNGMVVPNYVSYAALDGAGFIAWNKARRNQSDCIF